MTLLIKRFLLILAFTLPLSQVGLAEEGATDEEQKPKVTDYIAMNPPFVTHVGTPGASLTYLKAAVTLRASSNSTRPVLETHMPRLRHEMVMLFGEQTDADALSTSEGQNAVRMEAKKRINAVLEEQQTEESVADVLFTEFVVQR